MTNGTDRPCATAGCGRRRVEGDDLCAIHHADLRAFAEWVADEDGPRGFERARSIWRVNLLEGVGLTVRPLDMPASGER